MSGFFVYIWLRFILFLIYIFAGFLTCTMKKNVSIFVYMYIKSICIFIKMALKMLPMVPYSWFHPISLPLFIPCTIKVMYIPYRLLSMHIQLAKLTVNLVTMVVHYQLQSKMVKINYSKTRYRFDRLRLMEKLIITSYIYHLSMMSN